MTGVIRRLRVLVAAAAVWLCFATSASAQALIIGNVDIPGNGSVVSRATFYAAGWVFRADSGAYPDAVAVGFYNRDTRQWFYPRWWGVAAGVYRPDVRSAFVAGLPAVGAYTGYGLYTEPPPPGNWDMVIAWATYDGGYWYDWRSLTFVA